VRKRLGSAGAIIVLGVSGLSLALPGAAGAAASSTTASTTPPTSAVSTSCSSSTTIDVTAASTSSSPATASLTSTCAFTPGSTVPVTFLGTTISATANGTTGDLTLNFGATDPTLSVNSSPFETAVYGVNTVTATGTNSTGGTNVATYLVDIEQGSSTTGSSGNNSNSAGLAFTGADLAALIAAALALILMGTAVVSYTRRRANAAPRA
jgi:hypothetical protein